LFRLVRRIRPPRQEAMTCLRSWVHIGPNFPQRVPDQFRFGRATISSLTKSFVLSTHQVEKRVQHIRTDSLRVVTSDARDHSDLNSIFLLITCRGAPNSSPEFDNPASFPCRTHAGFLRDRRSYYLSEIHSLGETWYYGKARP